MRTDRALSRSQALLAEARELIPGASQTMSKGPTQWVQGVAPSYVTQARGARVTDVDGNVYLDWPMALGPILLGHADPTVDAAIVRQLADGITYTLPHVLELEVARRLVATIPAAERVRFGKTGSDATSAAVRVARAVTGRDLVLSVGYHGWHDWYVGVTSRSRGIPAAVRDLVVDVPFSDLDALREAFERHSGTVACVILEPVSVTEPPPGYLEAVVDLAHAHGALAVFDEIITGFRLGHGGAQERYGVEADLACFGKALGNGMPLSALTGRAVYMDVLEDVFFSGTHGGEALSLAAAKATLDVLASEPVHEHLWRLGGELQAGLRARIDAHGLGEWVTCSGLAPWTFVLITEPHPSAEGLPAKTLLQQELLKRGVLYNGAHFLTWAHTAEDVEETIEAYDGAFAVLADALPDTVAPALEGPPLQAVFRKLA